MYVMCECCAMYVGAFFNLCVVFNARVFTYVRYICNGCVNVGL